ncbi:patched family protein [Gregarina niphandrodes]|uniref:Patched family protein n=1 Tax=Gregarina niphandrodes TaxID=110365 RepID=A0A023B0B4_GRENI|nr:patched family protein [Gregarina niphandrodes]EZG45095.1 patched family protein [Gregarina niphandrodes]|eukprot:XP_011132558.1 patched family protein [Gregarina niphandrodes]
MVGFEAEPSANPRSNALKKISRLKALALERFRHVFYEVGGFIYDFPLWFIIGSLTIGLVAGLSFLNIQFETRADNLYALPASQARAELAKQASLFGDPPRISMVFVVSKDNSNVLTKPVLSKLERLDQYIQRNLTSDEEGWRFDDVCYRQYLKFGSDQKTVETVPPCVSMTPLDLYRNSRMYGVPIATRVWPYVPNLSQNKIVKADLAVTDPGIQRLPSGTVKLFNATGFLMLYDTASDKAVKAKSMEWEQAFINFINHDLKPFSADPGEFAKPDELLFSDFEDHDWRDFKVFVNAERSWQDELARSTKFDARLMRDYVIAYVIIATYMVVFNHTRNLVRSKSMCGFMGSVSALLGYLAGGGICYWAGLKHTPTMHASPFLVLAIGLDNTFVVLNFYTLSYSQTAKPKDRCRNALTDSGIALFITTFTSILSFAVGALGPYTAVRNFCIQTGTGLAGGFVFNIVFFYPFLCLEARAESQGRIFFLPDHWLQKLPPSTLTADSLRLLRTGGSPGGSPDSLVGPDHPGRRADPFQSTVASTQLAIELGSWHPRDPKLRDSRELNSLRHRFINCRSMFEVATLQWLFTDRLRELSEEVGKRNISLHDPMLLDDASSVLPTEGKVDLLETPTKDMLNCDIKAAHELSSMALHLCEEPRGNKGKRTRHVLLRRVGPLLVNKAFQFWMLFGMIVYLVVFAYTTVFGLTAGLDLQNLTPPDSYLREAFAVSHDKFPIFPQQTYITFTTPNDPDDSEIMKNFLSTRYGIREPESLTDQVMGFMRAEVGSETNQYLSTLGDIPWWKDETIVALLEMDRRLRALDEVQDVLNGMILFYQEYVRHITQPGSMDAVENIPIDDAAQDSARRLRFYEHLNNWLSGGVVGVHVRDQFVFDVDGRRPPVVLTSGAQMPQLLAFRLMVFNYNFLDSYSQSQYMLKVRALMKEFSEWAKRKPRADLQLTGSFTQMPKHKQRDYDAPLPPYQDILNKMHFSQPAIRRLIISEQSGSEAETDSTSRSSSTSGSVLPHTWFTSQAFMDTFLYFETDAMIWTSTALNMLTAFVSIIIASSILMKGFTNVVLVTLMICAVDIGVFGGMAMLGIQLNILSMILLVLSIGFSVDYTVHVIHTFCHTLGKNPNARAVETLILICSPVTHGAISTLLGILPIYFRKEFVMTNFFWMMALVIFFGFLNGVIFLPIIMAKSGNLLDHSAQQRHALDTSTDELVDALLTTKWLNKPNLDVDALGSDRGTTNESLPRQADTTM